MLPSYHPSDQVLLACLAEHSGFGNAEVADLGRRLGSGSGSGLVVRLRLRLRVSGQG